jgi:hypothetical protein
LKKREKRNPLYLGSSPTLSPLFPLCAAQQAAQLGPAQSTPPPGGFLQKVIFFPADQSCSVAAARPPDAPAGQDHLRWPRRPTKPPAAAKSNPRPPSSFSLRSLAPRVRNPSCRPPQIAMATRLPELRQLAQQLRLDVLPLLVHARVPGRFEAAKSTPCSPQTAIAFVEARRRYRAPPPSPSPPSAPR